MEPKDCEIRHQQVEREEAGEEYLGPSIPLHHYRELLCKQAINTGQSIMKRSGYHLNVDDT